jgi:hypothetical protein
MVPEILAQAVTPVDFIKSDVYLLGLCIVEAVTKEFPFANKDWVEVTQFKLENDQFEHADGFDHG